MNAEKLKALSQEMVDAIKSYVARALDARHGPVEARLLKLETQIAVLEARLGASK